MSFSALQGSPNTALPLRRRGAVWWVEAAPRLEIRWRGSAGLHKAEQNRSHARRDRCFRKSLIRIGLRVASGSGRVMGGRPPFDSCWPKAGAPSCWALEKMEGPQGGAGGRHAP